MIFVSYLSQNIGFDGSCKLREFAWNIKAYFLEEEKKKEEKYF